MLTWESSFLADWGLTFAAGALDVTGKCRLWSLHPGIRHLVLRRRPVGDLQLRQAAILRPHQRGGRETHPRRHHAHTARGLPLADLRAYEELLEDRTQTPNNLPEHLRQAGVGFRGFRREERGQPQVRE